MSFRFQFRRGTTAERNATNPILAAGEPAVVLDSGQPAELVLGDGVTAMADLRAAVWDDDARLALADTAVQPGAIAEIEATTPTTEEASTVSVLLATGAVSTAQTIPLLSALYPIALDQVSVATSAAVPASDADYWTIQLLRYRAGGHVAIATKTTKTVGSGGQAIAAFTGWSFDLVPFVFENLLAGDVIAVRLTPTGAPAALTDPTITFRTPAADPVVDPVVTVVSDTFTRANSTTALGTADTGQLWTLVGAPIFGISSGQVYSPNATFNERAFVDAEVSDCTVQVKIAAIAAGGSCGLFLRSAADGLTGFNLSLNAIFRYTAPSTNTQLGAAFSQTLVAGDTVRAKMSGPTITIYRDAGSTGTFVQVAQVTDTTNQTATRHGLRSTSNAALANRMDDFKVAIP